ncbi:MAG: T9SS type A sorting domain-containing protein [Chitinophagales bacterium]
MKRLLLIVTLLTAIQFVQAQDKIKASEKLQIQKVASVVLKDIHTDFNPQLLTLEMPAPGSESYRRHLIDLKEALYGNGKYMPTATRLNDTALLAAPEILTGWEGNIMGTGVPNDNDMAISNDGKIISVINSSIYIYNSDGSFLYSVSLSAFCDTLGNAYSKFDPKVLYDPRADKFVLLFLAGFTPEQTNVIIAFSETNDPLGEWNFYALPGNPKNNDRWTDFPMFALTEEELFLTINLIIPDEPWQTGFSETLIWQMSLDKGYNGDTIDAVYYDSIFFAGNPIRNLNPVRGGSTTYGPDMYFLSNRNFAESNDTIFIVHVTGKLDDPLTEVTVDYSRANISYGVPPQARQLPTHIFDTNDGRVLGSYYENNQIQFVSNTLDPTTGFCGVYHGIITDLEGTKNIDALTIGDDTLDIGYPNIAYTGKFDGDNQSIITFDHTAPTVFAGMSAVFYNWGAYSDLVNIKTGDTYVNVLSGAYERWGDYTGSQRKYNEPGVVWVSGNFGKYIDGFPFIQRNNATWIASLRSTVEPNVAIPSATSVAKSAIYPNPADNLFYTKFTLEQSGVMAFYLYDMNGRLIKQLLAQQGQVGENIFSFSTDPLLPGNYILKITHNQLPFTTHSIIIN